MSCLNETFVLENGVAIPKIGLGTWQVPNGETTYHAVSFALKKGITGITPAVCCKVRERLPGGGMLFGKNRQNIRIAASFLPALKIYSKEPGGA